METLISAAITSLFSLVGGAVAGYLTYRVMMRRLPSQNRKDDMDAAQTALEVAEKATKRVLELQMNVKHLEDMLAKQRYRLTVNFRLGDTPIIELATLERLDEVANG